MIEYQTFIEAAGSQAGTADSGEARRAVEAVLATVATALDEAGRWQLAAALPGALRGVAEVTGPAVSVHGGAEVVQAVSKRTGCAPERARLYVQAVLSAVAEAEPEVGRTIAERLPDGADLVAAVDQGVPPRGSGVPTGLTPRLLEPDEIERQLGRLTGWEGDQHRLRRTVVLPPDRVRPLRDVVARAEREMSHHARVEQQEGTVTFEVWTHSLDRVTDMDVELARRIDEAVDAVGAAG
jgi:pterin-4a-carbinolamine dehydratase/uncharacterized protein (DUF2267 family)